MGGRGEGGVTRTMPPPSEKVLVHNQHLYRARTKANHRESKVGGNSKKDLVYNNAVRAEFRQQIEKKLSVLKNNIYYIRRYLTALGFPAVKMHLLFFRVEERPKDPVGHFGGGFFGKKY